MNQEKLAMLQGTLEKLNSMKVIYPHPHDPRPAKFRSRLHELVYTRIEELEDEREALKAEGIDIEPLTRAIAELWYVIGRDNYEEEHSKEKAYSVAEKRETHGQAYAPWTLEADGQLEQLFCEGKTVTEIAAQFGRNEGAIRSRIKKLELREKYS